VASLEELANPDFRATRGPECGVKLIMQQLDKPTAELLATAFANRSAPSTSICAALRDLGHDVRANAIQRHRRGECRCS
jgi:hypothetical protein